MKKLNNYINEKLKIGKSNIQIPQYTCQPKDRDELRAILKERLARNQDADLNDIDVSQITDMNNLFQDLKVGNIKIDNWDVSNVTNMRYMFFRCFEFDPIGLENWDVSNVRDMSYMFQSCQVFNSDLSGWDVSNVKYMTFMFWHCYEFKGEGLENWKVDNVEDMDGMFYYCEKFDCDLNRWNVSKVENTNRMFYKCKSLKNKPSWYN